MHKKYILLPLLGLVAIVGVQAGQIQIGGTNGLTAAYIGSTVGGVTGSTGSWGQRSYTNALFNSVTLSNATSDGATAVPMNDTAPGSAGGANVIKDDNSGITYNLMNDGTGASGNTGNGNNIWASTVGAGTLVVPVDISDVDYAGIMLNDYWGFAGADPTVTFTFANAGKVSVLVGDAANGTGPITSSTDCQNGTGSITCPGLTSGHGAISATTPITTPVETSNAIVGGGSMNIFTSTIWSANYATNSLSANGPYHSATGDSSGQVMLDDLKFDLSAYSTDTLLSISFAPNTVATGSNISRLALSAITVDQVATPEPSTIVLLGLGFGLLGFRRLRRA
jgi:hypothetical protein